MSCQTAASCMQLRRKTGSRWCLNQIREHSYVSASICGSSGLTCAGATYIHERGVLRAIWAPAWDTTGVSPVLLSVTEVAPTRITVYYGRIRGTGKLGPESLLR